jgi:flagellar biogenesis protein FliO
MFRRRMGSYAGYLVETFITLLAVCGLAFVVLYGARRLGVGRPRGPIQLVGQLPLDARRAIYLVQVGGQVLVVGASEAGITRLGEVASGDLPPSAAAPVPFGDVLARVLRADRATSPGARPSRGGAHEAAPRRGASE